MAESNPPSWIVVPPLSVSVKAEKRRLTAVGGWLCGRLHL